MEWTKWDTRLFVTFLLIVVLMSFTFPVLGLTGSTVNESDIPEFNITAERFNWAGEFPENPETPSKGVLNHTSSEFDNYPGTIQTEIGKAQSNSDRIFLVAINETAVHLVNASDVQAAHNYTSKGEENTHIAFGYEIDVQAKDLQHGKFEYIIQQRPSDTAWYTGIPGATTAADLANFVAYIGVVIWWTSSTLVTSVLNIIGIILDLVIFFLNTVYFISTTYGDIVTGAPTNWASILVAMPGTLFSFMLGKMTMIVIGTLKP